MKPYFGLKAGKESIRCFSLASLVFCLLLVAGDVEANPGPHTIDDVMNLLGEMNSKFSEMNIKVDKVQEDIKDLKDCCGNMRVEIEDLKNDMISLQKTNDDLLNENDHLKERVTKLEKKSDDLEERSRRNNLIFYGLPKESESETNVQCEEKLHKLFKDDLNIQEEVVIDRAHRLGTSDTSPIIARLTYYKQKERILREKKILQTKNPSVSIGEDHSERVRGVRKLLLPHLKEAKKKKQSAFMVYDYLIIDNVKFVVDHEGKVCPSEKQRPIAME